MFFNSAQNCQIDLQILDELSDKEVITWVSFSSNELRSVIKKCSNTLTSGLDKLSWKHLKRIIRDDTCFRKFVDIVNVYIDLEYWLVYFKVPTTIIILKPNKESYNSPKTFWSIILLNTIGKLFKKAISERLQFVLVLNNFIHNVN